MKHNSREGQNQFETNNKQEEFEFRNAKIDSKKERLCCIIVITFRSYKIIKCAKVLSM